MAETHVWLTCSSPLLTSYRRLSHVCLHYCHASATSAQSCRVTCPRNPPPITPLSLIFMLAGRCVAFAENLRANSSSRTWLRQGMGVAAAVSPRRVLKRLIFQGNTWHDIFPRRLAQLFPICRPYPPCEYIRLFYFGFFPTIRFLFMFCFQEGFRKGGGWVIGGYMAENIGNVAMTVNDCAFIGNVKVYRYMERNITRRNM